jgi:Ca2+-transporting ATPase
MLYYTKTVQETLEEFEATERGLAVSQAEERLQLHGYNTIKFSGEPWWKTLIEPFANVFMLVLSVAVIISVLHHAFLDAAIISAIMIISAVIYYVQRFSTERILRSLQRHDAQSVQTLRDNRVVALDVSRLVPGDIIILQEGDKVPADARLIAADSLRVDETQLTGESTPISKQIDVLMDGKEIYEQSNMLFQGSFIISGEARALVVATGNTT